MNDNVNFNDSSEYIKEFTVFNNGEAGVVDNIEARITKRGADEKAEAPAYRLIFSDDLGEVNEGFFYFEKPDDPGFKSFQAGKLINLARGVLGEDIKFPEYAGPKEALDGVMKLVAPALSGRKFRGVVTYGTTRNPQRYLRIKSFGRFIEPMSNGESQLKLEASDNLVRKEEEPTGDSLIKQQMDVGKENTDSTEDLPF